jgi:SAM-dependent methyltransferase
MSMNYNSLARDYAKHRRTHPEVLRHLIEDGRLTFASRILDVGCGTGNYAVAIEQAVGCECWGIEPSQEMMATAKARAASARFKEGRAERLDFADAFFDLVLSVDVIHHVEDRPAHYREAMRVLRPGGLLCTVTDSEDIIRHREPLSTYFPETIDVELGRYPKIQDLKQMMLESGFTAIREETVEFRHALTDIQRYRDKAFSSLHLISAEAFARGMQRLEADLRDKGSVPWWSRYLMLWGTKR